MFININQIAPCKGRQSENYLQLFQHCSIYTRLGVLPNGRKRQAKTSQDILQDVYAVLSLTFLISQTSFPPHVIITVIAKSENARFKPRGAPRGSSWQFLKIN